MRCQAPARPRLECGALAWVQEPQAAGVGSALAAVQRWEGLINVLRPANSGCWQIGRGMWSQQPEGWGRQACVWTWRLCAKRRGHIRVLPLIMLVRPQHLRAARHGPRQELQVRRRETSPVPALTTSHFIISCSQGGRAREQARLHVSSVMWHHESPPAGQPALGPQTCMRMGTHWRPRCPCASGARARHACSLDSRKQGPGTNTGGPANGGWLRCGRCVRPAGPGAHPPRSQQDRPLAFCRGPTKYVSCRRPFW